MWQNDEKNASLGVISFKDKTSLQIKICFLDKFENRIFPILSEKLD